MKQKMTAQQAIETLSHSNDDYEAILVLADAVECQLDDMNIQYDSDGLQDWIGNGDYDGTETVDSIVAEYATA